MIPVGWTIFRDRFWDHLVMLGLGLPQSGTLLGVAQGRCRQETVRVGKLGHGFHTILGAMT